MAKGSAGQTLSIAALRKKARERTLTLLEEAQTCAHLLSTGKVKNQRELARLMGVSQARVSQRIALLAMPPPVVAILAQSQDLTERHARELRRLKDPKLQAWVAKKVVSHHLSVDETAAIVRSMLKELGIDPGARAHAGWVPGPNYRWRLHRGWLEIRVRGGDNKTRLKTLEQVVTALRKNPDYEKPHLAFDDSAN